MPIKQRKAVTRRDFADALQYLSVSVSEIAKAAGVPRAYLSDLRARNVPLRREHDEKLRAYLEGQGVEFENGQGDAPNDDAPAPHPALRRETVTRCGFPIAGDLDPDVVADALDAMQDNDARLKALLRQEAIREKGGFLFAESEVGYTRGTEATLKEIEQLLIENYLIFCFVRGWRPVKTAGEDGKETLRDLVIADYLPKLVDVGLIPPEPERVEEDS